MWYGGTYYVAAGCWLLAENGEEQLLRIVIYYLLTNITIKC
jgi:hypothetical protein